MNFQNVWCSGKRRSCLSFKEGLLIQFPKLSTTVDDRAKVPNECFPWKPANKNMRNRFPMDFWLNISGAVFLQTQFHCDFIARQSWRSAFGGKWNWVRFLMKICYLEVRVLMKRAYWGHWHTCANGKIATVRCRTATVRAAIFKMIVLGR